MFRFLYLLAVTYSYTLNTKQIVTVGPSSSSYTMLNKLHKCGVDIFRINMSHCKKDEDAQNIIDCLSYINENSEHKSDIMIDLQGPKFRIGKMKNHDTILKPGSKFIFDKKKRIRRFYAGMSTTQRTIFLF